MPNCECIDTMPIAGRSPAEREMRRVSSCARLQEARPELGLRAGWCGEGLVCIPKRRHHPKAAHRLDSVSSVADMNAANERSRQRENGDLRAPCRNKLRPSRHGPLPSPTSLGAVAHFIGRGRGARTPVGDTDKDFACGRRDARGLPHGHAVDGQVYLQGCR